MVLVQYGRNRGPASACGHFSLAGRLGPRRTTSWSWCWRCWLRSWPYYPSYPGRPGRSHPGQRLGGRVMGSTFYLQVAGLLLGNVFRHRRGSLGAVLLVRERGAVPFFDSVWLLDARWGMGVSGAIYGVIVIKLLQQLAIKLGPTLSDLANPPDRHGPKPHPAQPGDHL